MKTSLVFSCDLLIIRILPDLSFSSRGVYLVICRQRGIVFIVIVRRDGLNLKFDTEVVAI